ncbi:MAG: MFS transporter, partial [Staphylococcus epidermidis]|nr:MFS transporter [Staphylococcus epidermidis]
KNMKKMMSFYALTKNLGSSVGSTIMGYMYALNVGLFGSNLHNVLGLVLIIAVCLIVMWMTLYKSNTIQS